MDIAFVSSYSFLGFLLFLALVLAFFWKDYYIIFDRRLLFVVGNFGSRPSVVKSGFRACLIMCRKSTYFDVDLVVAGLMFSRSLSNSAVIDVLMWYFTDYGGSLVMSAVLSNIQDSLSSFLVIFMAHTADSFVGRFRTIVFSTTAYIGGLMLLWMFNPYDVKWLIVVALIFLAVGTSGGALLEDVVKDLVHRIDKSRDRTRKRSLARAAIWWRVARVSGAVSATLWVVPGAVGGVPSSWRSSFLICVITMAVTLMIFCVGHNEYPQGELTKRPVEIFLRVARARILKLLGSKSRCSRQERSSSPENLETKRPENQGIALEKSTLRLGIERQADGGDGSYKQDIVVVKSLLRMFPMWGSFFVVSLTSATGSTFFIDQYSNLNGNDKIPVQIYNLIQDLSAYVIPFLYRWIFCFHRNEKLKIGVGMVFSIVCCVFAWQLESHRLKSVKHLFDEDMNTSISFLWLVPQFCMLGCMEGLTEDGLLKFFKSQINEPMKSYGEEYIEVVMGLGKLFNIILILIFKRQLGWFRDSINDSQLDKYYRLLVYICSGNFVIYCCIAACFYKNSKQNQDSGDDLILTR